MISPSIGFRFETRSIVFDKRNVISWLMIWSVTRSKESWLGGKWYRWLFWLIALFRDFLVKVLLSSPSSNLRCVSVANLFWHFGRVQWHVGAKGAWSARMRVKNTSTENSTRVRVLKLFQYILKSLASSEKSLSTVNDHLSKNSKTATFFLFEASRAVIECCM